MKRRDFIQTTAAAAAVPVIINGMQMNAQASPIFEKYAQAGEAEDRVLVVIFLNGGNDGLNTVIPLDQYENLTKVRPQVLLPENPLLKLNDEVALHPAMIGLKELWDEGKFEIIQNVGYPNPNLSHFRSTDIWTSASDSDQFVGSGWIGRYLEEKHPEFPDNYPNENSPDPLSLTLGSLVSQTCQGAVYSMGMALNGERGLYDVNFQDEESNAEGVAIGEIDFVKTIIRQTDVYLETLQNSFERGSINEGLWENNQQNRLEGQLQTVAQLINGGLKTKVYVCSLNGFDTHANQVDSNSGNNLIGSHANLLQYVSSAINSFQKQIDEYGLSDKVLGMTFSEFGRRIIGNDSSGTDHGTAAPQFLFGAPVNPTIHGSNPIIPDVAEPQDNLSEEFDFRSIYSSVLTDWFQVSDVELNRIMYKNFNHIDILKPGITNVENHQDFSYNLKIFNVFPNPATTFTKLSFYTISSNIRLELYDSNGRFISVLSERYLNSGRHTIDINGLRLKSGNYILKLRNSRTTESTLLNVVN